MLRSPTLIPDAHVNEAPAQSELPRWVKFGLVLYLFLMFLPLQPHLAGINLIPFRLFLLVTIIPFTLIRIRSDSGFDRIDALMALLSFWVFLSFIVNHGMARFEFAVMSAIEYYGGFLVGRVLVTSLSGFRFFLNAFVIALALMIPFAVIENRTGTNLWLDFFRKFSTTNMPGPPEMRFGGFRVNSVFAHPIHFGIAGSMFLGCYFTLYRWGEGRAVRVMVALIVVFLAQSSAPMLSVGGQLGLLAWGVMSRDRWKLLLALFVAAFVFLSIASDRGPIIILVETMTLNPRTAWWRIHIWNFGIENVWQNPIFGLGMRDWVRPHWLAPTVDNFWLLIAMRHGLPAVACLIGAVAITITRIMRATYAQPDMERARLGYLISMLGYIIAFATVFAWGQMVALSMFFLGAGAFLFAPTNGGTPDEESSDTQPPTPRAIAPRYTRFPAKK